MVLAGSRDRNPINHAFQPDLWPRKQTKRQAETIKLAVARNRWFESISLQRRANFRFLSGGAPSCRVPKLAVAARRALPDRRLRCRLHPQRRPWRREVSAYQPASEQRATARPAAWIVQPARCAHAMKRSRAEQRGDNQIDRARVLEVRIHSPPAGSLLRTRAGTPDRAGYTRSGRAIFFNCCSPMFSKAISCIPRGVRPYASRDADAAGFRQGLEPARNIHTITKVAYDADPRSAVRRARDDR
jgi:hypothetical protein